MFSNNTSSPTKKKQAWTGHWRVFCCCRSLEHRWTCYQALLVYRSTISQLYCRRPVLQSSLMAVFSLLRWPTVEVKKAKGANFPNAECPWRNVLEHLAHVSCFQSCSMGLISMVKLAFVDLIFSKTCQHRNAHSKFLLSRFNFREWSQNSQNLNPSKIMPYTVWCVMNSCWYCKLYMCKYRVLSLCVSSQAWESTINSRVCAL